MICELSPEEFYKINHLLHDTRTNLEIKSVAEGFNPGWIFVDDSENPQTAMIWSKGIEGFYFLGHADSSTFNAEINGFIDKTIIPRAKALGLADFEFSTTSDAWDKMIPTLFGSRNLVISKQLVFARDASAAPTHFEPIDTAYTLRRVDPVLLADPVLDNRFLESAILEWWDSIDAFMENGVGTAIYFEDQAVCTCVTSFMNPSTMESHIQTEPDHRRRGLATCAVQAFVTDALEKGYTLYWDCMETNHGSRALAKKMNYQLQFTYPLYEFPLPAGGQDE